jgi:hypothetical protein
MITEQKGTCGSAGLEAIIHEWLVNGYQRVMDSMMPMRIWRVWPIQFKMTQPCFGVSLVEQGLPSHQVRASQIENGESSMKSMKSFESLLAPHFSRGLLRGDT